MITEPAMYPPTKIRIAVIKKYRMDSAGKPKKPRLAWDAVALMRKRAPKFASA